MNTAWINTPAKALIAFAITFAVAQPTLAVRPTVVKSTPDNGEKQVDPALRRITVEFDQDMDTRGGRSICGGGEKFPKMIGRPRWAGKRTFIITVRLQPNHDYMLSINCPAALNFRSAAGEPVVPYPIRFTTGDGGQGADAKAVPIAELNAAAVEVLREMIDQRYSYRDRLGLDWDALFDEHKKLLIDAKTPKRFAQIAGVMLAHTEDKHIWLDVDGERVPAYIRPMTPNANADLLQELVPNWKQHSGIAYTGLFDDGVGYIRIDSWSTRDVRAYEGAYRLLGKYPDMPGLVVDVRFNGGGSETLAGDFAGCFIDGPVLYAKNVYRDPTAEGGFTPVLDRVLEPNPGRPKYRGKIAVLSGPVVMSSCEAFVLMMKQVPTATVFGDTTQGGSGNPRAYDLGNGVTVYLSSWKAMLPDGSEFEGVGVEPDVSVSVNPSELSQRDPVLEAALEHLRK
jgi:Peptidase family S41/Bacterial Ig-like domain